MSENGRVMVTGGAGFLGTHLCEALLDRGYRVLCLDNLSTGLLANAERLMDRSGYEFLKWDLVEPYYPEHLKAIYNLACPASPMHYQYNPIRTLKMGTTAIFNVLGMAKRLGVPILQASTSEIYGDPAVHPQTESYWGNVNSIGPRACYDEGKRVAEALFMAYNQREGVDTRLARIFNTYGPFMDVKDGRVVSNFIIQALKGEPLTVFGDGQQTRSFCYVSDLVGGLMALMDVPSDDGSQLPVNLGNPVEFTMLELAEKVLELAGSSSELEFHPLPVDDPVRRCPDITRAKERLGWEPKVRLKDGLKRTIPYFEKALGLAK